MNKDQSIFVTGGTGFLGAHLLEALLAQGYTRISALKRSTSDMKLVRNFEQRIEWIEGDILDVLLLDEVLEGMDYVFHCAAVVSYDPREVAWMRKVNIEGTTNVVNACLHHKVAKLVHVSSISAIAKVKDSNVIKESNTWEVTKDTSQYGISKFQSEMEVWRGSAEGLPVAIVNPSVILGRGFWDRGTANLFKKMHDEFPFYSMGAGGFVDVRDVVNYMIRLAQSDINGERYLLNGDNWSFEKLFTTMAQAFGKRKPPYKVTPLIREVAWRVEWLRTKLTGGKSMITKETARSSAQSWVYANDKSLKLFDFEYTPIEDTIKRVAKDFIAEQKAEKA